MKKMTQATALNVVLGLVENMELTTEQEMAVEIIGGMLEKKQAPKKSKTNSGTQERFEKLCELLNKDELIDYPTFNKMYPDLMTAGQFQYAGKLGFDNGIFIKEKNELKLTAYKLK